MNINDLEKLKVELEKNHKAYIKAIESHLAKMREAVKATVLPVQLPRFKKPTSQIVEEIITNSDCKFTISDICLKIREQTGKEPSGDVGRIVSQVINKLRQRKPPEIIEVEKGMGSRSGTYTYIKQ